MDKVLLLMVENMERLFWHVKGHLGRCDGEGKVEQRPPFREIRSPYLLWYAFDSWDPGSAFSSVPYHLCLVEDGAERAINPPWERRSGERRSSAEN
jgi:hypothetical protein